MTPCPVCQKPVDTLRARHVAVRAGKVVAYCSPECLAKANGQPVPITPAAPETTKTPPGGAKVPQSVQDLDSGPVIEIVHEPVSGVVTSARDPRDSTPIPADKRPASITTEIDPREVMGVDEDEDDGGEDADEGDGDDEAAGEPRAGRSTERRRRDSMDAKMAHDWLDDEPADVRPGTLSGTEEEPAPARRGRGMLVLLLFLLLAAGGVAVYKLVYLPRMAASSRATLPTEPTTMGLVHGSVEQVPPAVDAAAPPAEDKQVALDRALEVLRNALAANSARVQIKAADALARTGDAAAIARLIEAIDKDKGDEAARIERGYALARAGNQRGRDLLTGELIAPRRDDRLAAARHLTDLGDQRAVPALVNFLDLPQNRLQAAVLLARFADPKGIAALEQVKADDKASEDSKLTATIALVVAGKQEHTAEVRKLLEDTRFNVDAADALVRRHDEAARPTLEAQLGVSQLRVEAARGLRRLAPDRDMAPYLDKLVTALRDPKQNKDTEQIPTAEAILMLAGPASWAEYK